MKLKSFQAGTCAGSGRDGLQPKKQIRATSIRDRNRLRTEHKRIEKPRSLALIKPLTNAAYSKNERILISLWRCPVVQREREREDLCRWRMKNRVSASELFGTSRTGRAGRQSRTAEQILWLEESLSRSFGRNIISCLERLKIQKVAMFASLFLGSNKAPHRRSCVFIIDRPCSPCCTAL